MAAMLAAIMSTLDSGMNSMATIWLKEVHQRYINKNLSNQQQVSVSRWATFIVGIIAISMALLLGFSGRWLTQSAAEIGTLFYILGAVNVPAFVLAVFSSRVRPSLIWLLVFFSIGYSISTKLWYGLSRSALQSWTEGAPLSWAGPLSYGYVITPLLAALLLAGTWILFKELRRNKFVITLGLAGTFAFGFAVGMLVWALYSNTLIEASPLARSFNFNLPIVWLFAFVGLCFFPKRPREEYQGLTIFTVNQPILKQKEDSPGE